MGERGFWKRDETVFEELVSRVFVCVCLGGGMGEKWGKPVFF